MNPLLVSAGANVVGGIVANEMSREEREAYKRAVNEAFQMLQGVNLPDTEKMRLALEDPKVQGILQPYMQNAEQAGPSAYETITSDPKLRSAQMETLDAYSKIGSEGLTAKARMELNTARREVAQEEQARQNAILQNMAMRGVGGSGMELAAKLSSSQSAANRQAQQADRAMAEAEQLRLEGIARGGQLAGQIRGQDYGEQSDKARARDIINQFNTQQRAMTQGSNVGTLNQAQASNLSNKQRVHEVGVGTHNAQQQYNAQLLQQQFDNEMRKTQAMANAKLGQAGMHQSEAGRIAGMYQGIGSGVGQAAMGYGMMQNDNSNMQKMLAAKYGNQAGYTNKGNPVGIEREFNQGIPDSELEWDMYRAPKRIPGRSSGFGTSGVV